MEYEMDSEDERFVHTINEASNKVKGRNQSSSSSRKQTSNLLTDDGFEKMIDVLEKEAFRKVHKVFFLLFLVTFLFINSIFLKDPQQIIFRLLGKFTTQEEDN